jgi:putative DNA primase/helicase
MNEGKDTSRMDLDDGSELLGAEQGYEAIQPGLDREIQRDLAFERINRLPDLERNGALKDLRDNLYKDADLRKFRKVFGAWQKSKRPQVGDSLAPNPNYPFRSTATGVLVQAPSAPDNGPGAAQWIPLCSSLEIIARTCTEQDMGHGRLLRLSTRSGTVHEFAIPMELFAGKGDELRRLLLDRGLELHTSVVGANRARAYLSDYIQASPVSDTVLCFSRVGWHTTAEGRVFIHHAFAEAPAGHAKVVPQTGILGPPGVGATGQHDVWRSGITALLAGNHYVLFAASAAFVGPLLELLGEPSGGFHFIGRSKRGKSALLALAASVWGKGSLDAGIQPWRGTTNGVESAAAQYSATLLALDEIGAATPWAVEEMIYLLANERAKARANADGTSRTPTSWKIMMLSTGEVSVEQRAHEVKRRGLHAGAKVRLADLPVEVDSTNSVFHDLGAETVERACANLYRLASTHYGHAGRIFVRWLVEKINADDSDVLVDSWRSRLDAYADDLCKADGEQQVRAVARRMALVRLAGELAVESGALPDLATQTHQATAAAVFSCWQTTQPAGHVGAIEVHQGLEGVKTFLETQRARFLRIESQGVFEPDAIMADTTDDTETTAIDARTPPREQAGYVKDTGEGEEWWVSTQVWKRDVCDGFEAGALQREMRDRGWIETDGKSLAVKRTPPGGSRRRFVVIKLNFLSEVDDILEGARAPRPTNSEEGVQS